MNRMIVTRLEDRIVSAFLKGERIYDLLVSEEDDNGVHVGDVFVSRVRDVVDNIRAAFVELRPGVVGYLPLTESERKTVKPEQELIVQVRKPAKGTKDAVLTTDIELVGRYVIWKVAPEGVQISRKIRDVEAIHRLEGLFSDIGNDYGLTIRTNAASADDTWIKAEAHRLSDIGKVIQDHGSQRTLYSRLYQEPPFYIRLINSYPANTIDCIVSDQEDICEELNSLLPEMDVSLYEDTSYPPDARYAISTTMKKAEERLVWLKSGANLIIDRTEAMTVIDVNTAKAVEGKRAGESTFFKINKEAAEEVARQLRLRNLSGIILVDFIDMKEKEHIDALIALLRDRLREDPVKAMYIDMTKLGIVEITRAKQFS